MYIPIGIADETLAPGAERGRVSAQPNPFAVRTTLVIDLVHPSEIDIRITNALGRVVVGASPGGSARGAPSLDVEWAGRPWPAGSSGCLLRGGISW